MVARNFRFLHKYYNDKQEVLARMFGVPQSNISAYASGKKKIPTHILKCISDRYNVSMDDLLSKDLELEYDTPLTITLGNIEAIGNNWIPILTSKIAETNKSFTLAHNILLSSLNNIDLIGERTKDLESAVTLFQQAWEEAKTYCALSNSIATVLLIYGLNNQRALQIGKELLTKGHINTFDIEYDSLHDPRKKVVEPPYEKQQKVIFEKYDNLVYDNIKILKTNDKYSELGDFCLAMCYWCGFAEDFIDYEDRVKAALWMLLQLCKLDNEYAERFIESISQIS